MGIKEDIAALRRGELDLEALKQRLQGELQTSGNAAAEVLQTLDNEHDNGDLTQTQYEQLTQFVTETIAPSSPSPDGNRGHDDLPDDASDDNSMTRLATNFITGDDADPATTVDVGMRLRDRFILDEVIGVGGMGTVYRGRDVLKIEAHDRNPFVAIKVLNETFKQRPDSFIALQREASRQQRLAHPNIATVFDFDRSGGVMFITMEYLDGRTLDQFIKDEVRGTDGLPLAQILPMLQDICSALSHAHDRNIVHADFKPGNVFITRNDRVKVLDFGIARAMKDPAAGANDQTLFDARTIGALTPAYASPEMLADSHDADPRDDIYALACVTYELLSGKHPFHRIPADQAKDNNLKPARIKHLSRRQNEVLARALSFDRGSRTPSAQQFLQELRGSSAHKRLSWPVLGAAAGILLIVAAVILVPQYMDQRNFDAVLAQLRSGNPERVNAGLKELADLAPEDVPRLLQESRPALLTFFGSEFSRLMNKPDVAVDFSAVHALLESANPLFPDSAALRELTSNVQRRKDVHLSDLSSRFEQYLATEYLSPLPDREDLPDLLKRLNEVDPTSPLLSDTRIGGAYAAAADRALGNRDYDASRLLIDTGLTLMPEDPGLKDLRDQQQSIDAQLALQARIQDLEQTLLATAQAVEKLGQLNSVQPSVDDLRRLDPENTVVATVGKNLQERLQPELAEVLQRNELASIGELLLQQEQTWINLGQGDVARAMKDRQRQLRERQDELVTKARQTLTGPDFRTSDGETLQDLLTSLARIDPADAKIEVLRNDAVATVRARARKLSDEGQWDGARNELAKGTSYATTTSMRESLQEEQDRVLRLETEQRERAEIAERQAAMDREEASRAAEAARREAKQRTQKKAIADAGAKVTAALAEFSTANVFGSLEKVQRRRQELEALDPGNPLLGSSGQALKQLVIAAIEQQQQPEKALEMLADTREALGASRELQMLESRLVERKAAAAARVRAEQISAAQGSLREALADNQTLTTANGRRNATTALNRLIDVAGSDSTAARDGAQSYTKAHVDVANKLIDAKRFSAASEILAAVATVTPGSQSIGQAHTRLESEQSAYRLARAAQQHEARLEALAERLKQEVRAGQLSRGETTLKEYRDLNANVAFARVEAPALLADAYAREAERQVSRNGLTNAGRAVQGGRRVAPADPRWPELDLAIDIKQQQLRVLAWFQGSSNRSTATIMQTIDGLKQREGAYVEALQQGWAAAALQQLSSLRHDREAHNRFLADAQSLLPDSLALARIEPIEPPKSPPVAPMAQPQDSTRVSETARPTTQPLPIPPPALPAEPRPEPTPQPVALSLNAIAGRWCGDQLEMSFSDDKMAFKVSGQRLEYPIDKYEYEPDVIRIFWTDRRVGSMIFEFGAFNPERTRMMQLRGRKVSSSAWQSYNRALARCR